MVLAKPQAGISTGFVYENLKFQNIKKHPDTKKIINAIAQSQRDVICNELCNVLETVTIEHRPVVKEIKDYLGELGAQGVLMSGSGPTVFGLFNNYEASENAAEKVKARFKIKDVYVTEIQNG